MSIKIQHRRTKQDKGKKNVSGNERKETPIQTNSRKQKQD
jgi:hypothetical protein